MTTSQEALRICRSWAAQVRDAIGAAHISVFGSLVARDAAQFAVSTSDIDMVLVLPRDATPVDRAQYLLSLLPSKHELELRLLPALQRADASRPIVSLIVATPTEVSCDVHKSRVRDFFRTNHFSDLLDDSRPPSPLLSHKPLALPDSARQAYEYAQTFRNKLLAVAAANLPTVTPWDDQDDPCPKPIMRLAALARSSANSTDKDGKYDLALGLDIIHRHLQDRATTHPLSHALFAWLSVRRGARGPRAPLSPNLQTLLTEELLAILPPLGQIKSRPRKPRDQPPASGKSHVRINGYKLFYYRHKARLTYATLARRAHVHPAAISRLESVRADPHVLDVTAFALSERKILRRLERALNCKGCLEGGRADDFLTAWMLYYSEYRHSARRKPGQQYSPLTFRVKVAVFDFDGTLTRDSSTHTTWEKLWAACGYDINDCAYLHRRFREGAFSHQQWCNITCEKFRERGLSTAAVDTLAASIQLVDGFRETVEALRAEGITCHILSGSIRHLILRVLGSSAAMFDQIRANDMLFDARGVIRHIHGTPYDFEGKAAFLRQVVAEQKISPLEVFYVGNSCNDIHASKSGVRTLCVNPRFTDPDNPQHWTYAIREMTSLRQILPVMMVGRQAPAISHPTTAEGLPQQGQTSE